MTETTQEEREAFRSGRPMSREFHIRAMNDADRLTQAESENAELRQRLADQFANQMGMADWVEMARQIKPEQERLRDRLAKLEDGIRALADVCDVYDTDDVQIDPQWVTKRLRAILDD